jgi:hypothetical protein
MVSKVLDFLRHRKSKIDAGPLRIFVRCFEGG